MSFRCCDLAGTARKLFSSSTRDKRLVPRFCLDWGLFKWGSCTQSHEEPSYSYCQMILGMIWHKDSVASTKRSDNTIEKKLVCPPSSTPVLLEEPGQVQIESYPVIPLWLTDYWNRLQEGILFLTSFRGKINSISHAHFLFQPQLPQKPTIPSVNLFTVAFLSEVLSTV